MAMSENLVPDSQNLASDYIKLYRLRKKEEKPFFDEMIDAMLSDDGKELSTNFEETVNAINELYINTHGRIFNSIGYFVENVDRAEQSLKNFDKRLAVLMEIEEIVIKTKKNASKYTADNNKVKEKYQYLKKQILDKMPELKRLSGEISQIFEKYENWPNPFQRARIILGILSLNEKNDDKGVKAKMSAIRKNYQRWCNGFIH